MSAAKLAAAEDALAEVSRPKGGEMGQYWGGGSEGVKPAADAAGENVTANYGVKLTQSGAEALAVNGNLAYALTTSIVDLASKATARRLRPPQPRPNGLASHGYS